MSTKSGMHGSSNQGNTLQVSTQGGGGSKAGKPLSKQNDFPKLKEDHIFKKLNAAEQALEKDNLEEALI
jgi:hypothetical protein